MFHELGFVYSILHISYYDFLFFSPLSNLPLVMQKHLHCYGRKTETEWKKIINN